MDIETKKAASKLIEFARVHWTTAYAADYPRNRDLVHSLLTAADTVDSWLNDEA